MPRRLTALLSDTAGERNQHRAIAQVRDLKESEMRLTLRTMLAHLCGLLEPEDARALEDKINQSERGRNLTKRIPDLIANPELDAPRVDSRAAGSEPNIISEYLDGILPPEKTAQFDRVCLQSDRQLAEVASCFEILSIVHQRPAKVSSRVRQRIYGLAARVDEPHAKAKPKASAETGPMNRNDAQPEPADPRSDELTPRERAAILEEYVDAPVLKAVPRFENEKSTQSKSSKAGPSKKADADRKQARRTKAASAEDRKNRPDDDNDEGENWFAESGDKDQKKGSPKAGDPASNQSHGKQAGAPGSTSWTDFDEFGRLLEGQVELTAPKPPDVAADGNPSQIESPPVASAADSQIDTVDEDEIAAPPITDPNQADADWQEEQVAVDTSAGRDEDADDSKPIAVPKSHGKRLLPFAGVAVVMLVVAAIVVVATGGHESVIAMFSGSDDLQDNESDGAGDATSTDENAANDETADQDETNGSDEADSSGTANQGGGGTPDSDSSEDSTNDPTGGSDTNSDADTGDDAGSGNDDANDADDTGVVGFPEIASDTDSPDAVEPDDPNLNGNDVDDPNRATILEGEPIGKLISSDQVVTRYLAEAVGDLQPGWYRLPNESALYETDQVLCLPSYRGRFSIGDSLFLTLIEASGLEVLGQVDGHPKMALVFGRMILETNGKASVEAEIQAAEISGKITFADSDSMVSVRAITYLPPGSNPETALSTSIIDVVAVRGRVVWEDGDRVEVLDPGQAKRYVDGRPEEVVSLTSIPYWVDHGVAGIDLTGSRSVAELIAYDKSVGESLEVIVDDPHVEVRMLAARCLSLLGEHEYCIKALAEDRNKSYWSDQIEWLREIASRGPAHAESMRQTFRTIEPEFGDEAFELLVGFDQETVRDGAGRELVELLESRELMMRVLAIDNLLRITGTRGMYRPETSERIREGHVRNWQKRLERGEVQYQSPPSPPTISGHREGE